MLYGRDKMSTKNLLSELRVAKGIIYRGIVPTVRRMCS
jgi:hypothetical protein